MKIDWVLTRILALFKKNYRNIILLLNTDDLKIDTNVLLFMS